MGLETCSTEATSELYILVVWRLSLDWGEELDQPVPDEALDEGLDEELGWKSEGELVEELKKPYKREREWKRD